MKLDSAGLIQQSICNEKRKTWTILNWNKRAYYTGCSFNTRPVARNPCQKPFVFYLSTARVNSTTNQIVGIYNRHQVPHPDCNWRKIISPTTIDKIMVYKGPDPHLWDMSPRRNCCRLLGSGKKKPGVGCGCMQGR